MAGLWPADSDRYHVFTIDYQTRPPESSRYTVTNGQVQLLSKVLDRRGVQPVIDLIHELVASINHDYPEKAVTLKFYRCTWKANEPQALGCPDLRWVSAEELRRYEFPEADVKLIELLTTRDEFWGSHERG